MEEVYKVNEIYDVSKCEFCSICQQTMDCTVQCAVEDKIICIKCLSLGKVIGKNDETPSYLIKDKLDFPIFEPSWTAEDELRLLDGVAKAGIDNWFEVHLKYLQNKSAEEIEAHFYSFYNINK